MSITSAKVIKGCISCKNCENICPEIFKVNPTSKVISDKFNENAIKLLMAEKMCPVQVIKVEKEGSYTLENPKAKLVSKKYLSPETLELIFSCDDFVFQPGQYVSLQMSDIRGDFSRSYSVASASNSSFTLTVKLLKQGRGSSYLRKLGERSFKTVFYKRTSVEFIGALGDFVLQHTPARKVMISTGTGLAPMMAMLEALPDGVEKVVVFGGRYEKDLYYIDKLKSFKNTDLRICVSRPSTSYNGSVGRVTDYIHDVRKDDEVYICGNPDMVQEVVKTLKDDGHPDTNIFHEDFTLASKPEALWKSMIISGNIPGISLLQNILIFFGVIFIPGLYFFAIKYGFVGTEFLRTSIYDSFFSISWYTVVLLMLIRPLADIFPKIGIFRRLIVLRKGLGIVSASIIVTMLLAKWIQNPFTFTAFFTANAWSYGYPILSRLSEVTAIILLVTSNNFSQKTLGIWWKRIQRTSYIYFVSGGLVAAHWSPDKYIYETIAIVGVLWIIAKIKHLKK